MKRTSTTPKLSTRTTIDNFLTKIIKLSQNIPPSLNPNFKLSTANRLSYAGVGGGGRSGHGTTERDRLLNYSTSGSGRRNDQRVGSSSSSSSSSNSNSNSTSNNNSNNSNITSRSPKRKNVIQGDSDHDREVFVSSIGREFEVLKEGVYDGTLLKDVS